MREIGREEEYLLELIKDPWGPSDNLMDLVVERLKERDMYAAMQSW